MRVHHCIKTDNKPIYLDVNLTEKNNRPLVIFSHGFKGFKDWGSFNYVSNVFAERGLNFLKFNFSHNGLLEENHTHFTDLESFGKNNFSIELDDLQTVIDWTVNHLSLKVDLDRMYLIGHSRGGGISIIKASEEQRIKKIVSWASVSDFEKRIVNNKVDLWKKRGVAYIYNKRTNQQLPLYYQFYENFIQNKDRFSIPKACQSLSIPSLIIHGKDDETVDFSEAIQLHNYMSDSKLLAIDNCNHVFNAQHPFDDTSIPKELKMVIDESIIFLKQ